MNFNSVSSKVQCSTVPFWKYALFLPRGRGLFVPRPVFHFGTPQKKSQAIVLMTKCRGFSIVLHDVHKGLQAKEDVDSKVQTLPWRQYVIAEELYNHQEGSHIHVFIQLRNPVHFISMLKIWCAWWKSGRVQVDQLRGSMAQACIYITPGCKKDKHLDEAPLIRLGQEDAELANVGATVKLLPTCSHERGWISQTLQICKNCLTPGQLEKCLECVFPGGIIFSGHGTNGPVEDS